MDLGKLRSGLFDLQIQILDHVFEFWLDRDDWPLLREVYRVYGKVEVEKAIEGLGGSVFYQEYQGGPMIQIRLTFLGFFLTSQGRDIEELLVRYLQFIKERYKAKDASIDQFTAVEVMQGLGLNAEQSLFLGKILAKSHSPFQGGGVFGNENWQVTAPKEIEDFPYIEDFNSYIEGYILKDYNPDLPANPDRRVEYYQIASRAKEVDSEFSFISTPRLQEILASDWLEAQKVFEVEAWKSCVILSGSVLEGMLIDVLQRDVEEATAKYVALRMNDGHKLKRCPAIHRWRLFDLVNVAEEMRLLSKGSIHITHGVREFRNMVHPGKQLGDQANVDKIQAEIAINAVKICLNQLLNLSADIVQVG